MQFYPRNTITSASSYYWKIEGRHFEAKGNTPISTPVWKSAFLPNKAKSQDSVKERPKSGPCKVNKADAIMGARKGIVQEKITTPPLPFGSPLLAAMRELSRFVTNKDIRRDSKRNRWFRH